MVEDRMDEIKLLRDRYYSAISLLQFDDDIMDALPKPNYRSFFL